MFNSKNSMPTAKSSGRKSRNDIILLGVLIFAISIIALLLYLFSETSNSVTVTIDGKLYGTYPLNENITFDINTGTDNKEVNRLVIVDGKAYISFATCPDGICAKHRPISRTGESIICLPHKVVVKTNSNTESIIPDIVA